MWHRLLLVLFALVTACSGPPASPTPTPTIPAGLSVGDVRTIRATETGIVYLMVQEGAYYLQQKARDEADSSSLASVWRNYQHVDVPGGTRVRILKYDRGTAQVEVLDGPFAGRRGWVPDTNL